MIYIILFVGVCVVVGLWVQHANTQETNRQQKITDLAIAEGRKAATEGRKESECPYDDDGSDPKNTPIGVLAVVGAPGKSPRFWWLAAYRTELRSRARSEQPNMSDSTSPRKSSGMPTGKGMTREFLYPLSQEEKVAVTGLSSAVYEAIITSKRAGYTSVTSINLDTPSLFDVGSLLWKLDIADLEGLAESLKLTLQADRAAGSDMARAAQLYQNALQINPFDAVAAMSCGVALAKQGDLREGIKWLERAHDLAPNNERITRNLAAIKSYL